MSWNYRVLKKEEKLGLNVYDIYQIIEVFYEDGKIHGWSDVSDSVLVWSKYEDLKGTYELLKHAFDKPVLELINGELVNIDKNDIL